MISRFEGIFRQTQIAKRDLFPLHGPLYLHVDTLPGLGSAIQRQWESSQETGLTCRALAYVSDSQAAKGCHKHRIIFRIVIYSWMNELNARSISIFHKKFTVL